MPTLKTLISAIFSAKPESQPQAASMLAVGEEISSTGRYHLQLPANRMQALCGAKIMQTRIPVQAWGMKTHLDEHYCVECAALAGQDLATNARVSA